MKVSDHITNILSKHTSVIFGGQGSSIIHLVDSIKKHKKLTFIPGQSEQGSSLAADAYYRTSGKIGVTIGTSGPGILNFLQGMGCSYYDSIPSLYIAGAPVVSHLRKNKLITVYLEDVQLEEDNDPDTLTQRFLRKARGIAKGVTVGGIENTMISYPKCCSPIPGDDIIGYITRGRGVTIHRSNCKNLPIKKNRDRIITVEWDLSSKNPFLVRLKITFEDRKNLLNDLTDSTSSLNINIKSVDISAIDGLATCLLIIEVKNLSELTDLKKKIISSINPINIERV